MQSKVIRKEIQYPILGTYKDSGIVILFTSKGDEDYIGTVVSVGGSTHELGTYATNWSKNWVPFNQALHLSNKED